MLKTERGTIIGQFIASHPDADLHERYPIELAGLRTNLSVYRLPIKLLTYSIRNGRFAAELLQEEAKQHRKIGETTEDIAIIRKLLLEQNSAETEALKRSLRQVGQLYSGIATYDGYVINGNRRMAVLERLQEEEHDPKYEYLQVARLPPTVDPKDLWRIEAGIQLSKEDRLEYGPINERLKLKEGIDRGVNEGEISRVLFGRFSTKQVQDRLKELKLVEDYLEYINQPKQYLLVEGRMQSFVDMRAGLDTMEDLGKDSDTIFAYVQMAYEMIKNESSHWDMRDLTKMFRTGGDPEKSIVEYYTKVN